MKGKILLERSEYFLEELIRTLNLDFRSIITTIFVIMAGFVFAYQLIGKFSEILGKPFKWYTNRNQDYKELKNLVEELKNHKENNDKVEEVFVNFMNEMNIEMQNYNNNRIHDRQQSFDIQRQLTSTMDKIAESAGENKVLIDALLAAQKEMMAEKINEKYKNYIAMDGIPEDEYDEFVALHAAYNGVGGNHHGDAKYNYCINNLKVKPVEIKVVTREIKKQGE